ncbi:MAG TPA: endonuclease/exonuclease/phosphatase family protein [Candidatus Dormibacteraeota bacterium]|jgi:endonuclease/exonuclease/phosphatase family metal-dependent hydrolase
MRICTWNIQLGLRLDGVLDTVRRYEDFRGLDLFAIQEASIHGGREDGVAIAEAMGPGYECFQATAQVHRRQEQGNALIWRKGLFEAQAPEIVSLSRVDTLTMTRAEQALLRAIRPQQRMAIRVESDRLRVYVMHLDVVGFTHKLRQLTAVLDDMTSRPPVPLTLLAGDLNTFGPPRLVLWRKLRAAAHAAGLVELTRGVRRTHWTRQKLDAIYARAPAVPKHKAWTLKVRASDHLPVFAEL